MQTTFVGVLEPRCLSPMLRQSPPGLGGHLSSGEKVAGCLEPENGAASEALWLPPVPEAISFCIPHTHLWRILLVGSRNQDVCCRCSGNVLPGQADPYLLSWKVAGYLRPEKGAALEALWLLPVPEAFRLCIPHSHLCQILLAGSQNQDVCC